ncbi:hypothetical protein VTP01DRAFT_6896 [Rhizomucor pusillus]|uniref:uncharacterized protein n=1 Tax=Rhizomucor pusillus TaxID=4840 RepID=UPI0037433F12
MVSMSPHAEEFTQQRPFRIRKSLRELIHRPKLRKQQKDLSLPLPSLPDGSNSAHDEYVYDILYECQRGSWIVGYSSKTLLQFDPDPWCDANMQFTPMDPSTYQLPDPSWEWVSKEWMVDMSGDVDESGWQYALKFHGAVWHGNYKHFRSFVRRRRWIRLRHRKKALERPKPLQQQSSNANDVQNGGSEHQETVSTSKQNIDQSQLLQQLKQCRLDRERLSILNNALQHEYAAQELAKQAKDILNTLDFEASKCAFLKQLHPIFQKSEKSPALTSHQLQALQSLKFYTDMEKLVDTSNSNL